MKAKKSLGQNFLTSQKIVEDIIRAADLRPDDVVLEVGPGKGILTQAILEKIPYGKLIAVEKDKRMVEYLEQKFKNNKNLKIIHSDILKFDICNLFEICNLKFGNFKVVANIPYYITSHFLRIFLQGNPEHAEGQPSRMVLMVQKEVAKRIVARDKKESILSISVKVYGAPKIIKKVPAKYFSPKPKVDSAILLIDNISKDFFRDCATLNVAQYEKKFFTLVKQGFSSKRKMLKNNLKMLDTGCLIRCKIPQNVRAEDLSLENWKCLCNILVKD
ncbi:ribosomal RNA small subunit methyltransferase A [Patescibacteria group bacterium]|nr:ribosomal RNA small subunit methyltransferase A [Patescibacteria group bacterium]